MFSRSQIKEIANEIWNLSDETVDLESFCERKLKEFHPGISDLEIADDIDKLASQVKRQLDNKITSFRGKGVPPNFEFDDYLPYVLCRHRSNNDNNDWVIALRKYRNDIKSSIKNMDAIAFEHLCKHVLEINGIIKSFVTRPTKEGGVDFYGLLEMCNYTQGVLLNNMKLRIIGQAKHRSGDEKVGEKEIDEIRTKYSDFQSGQGTAIKVLPDWFTKTCTPVICIVITTTDFTRGARESAERDGIILRDGDQITEDIIHSPRLNEWFHTDKDGNRIFNQQLFLRSFSAI
ncbi:restriction endonuclease [Candidatus Poribacteria bacterium]|nr:restriction endonuclease [Candidatus Poribacteria bacterium]